jgi:hypothetical protein
MVTKNGLFDYARFGDEADRHQPDNTTAYDKAIRQVYVTGVVWGYSNTSGLTTSNMTPPASLTCLRANSVKEGSRRLSAGVSLRAGSLWLMTSVIGIVLALLC